MVGDTVLTKAGGFNTDSESEMYNFNSATIDGAHEPGTITYKERFEVYKMMTINDGLLRATPDHLMVVKKIDANGDRMWQVRPLYFCEVGEFFLDVNNNEVEITSATQESGTFYVWKMDIEDNDVYYGGGILNHNFYYDD